MDRPRNTTSSRLRYLSIPVAAFAIFAAAAPAGSSLEPETQKRTSTATAVRGTGDDMAPELAIQQRTEAGDFAANEAYKARMRGMSPRDALQVLIDGNLRFESGEQHFDGTDQLRRCDTFLGQQPTAMVLTCSDSRVTPEYIFDGGIGEMYTLRSAGNVVTGSELGSAEYAVEHLKVPVIVVMGHTSCNAVSEVVKPTEHDEGHAHSQHLKVLLEQIQPAASEAKRMIADGGNFLHLVKKPAAKDGVVHVDHSDELVELAVERNVLHSMGRLLQESAVVREAVKNGDTALVGAVYDIHLGQVRWVGLHPDQVALVQPPLPAGQGVVGWTPRWQSGDLFDTDFGTVAETDVETVHE